MQLSQLFAPIRRIIDRINQGFGQNAHCPQLPGTIERAATPDTMTVTSEMNTTQRASVPAPSDLLNTYAANIQGFDELLGPDGQFRSHWAPVISFLEGLGVQKGNAIHERVQRRIVENGLTLDSFSDPTNATQPWKLDLIPLILAQQDWVFIERAVHQRIRLFEMLLSDLYGEQKCLSDGTLPSTLVHADPTFLRPMHGTKTALSRLCFLAIDFARDAHGNWRVIDTHAETIAGHGFALANRIVLADALPQLFRSCNARRLSRFYQEVANGLAARTSLDEPTIALLGPDPDDETYLSHAYMARYFGYPLLEGLDLRVVGDKVYLKTLSGLQQVDMLVRAVEASKCDPLELDPDGFAGPAGLVQALRHAPQCVANTLGTAIVENRGLAPFLPQLCQKLLGEDLIIADANRLWLGDGEVRRQVLNAQDQYVIREAFEAPARPGHAHHARRLSALSPEDRENLITELDLNGVCYVAEQPETFATAPSWTSNGLAPKPFALRVFAANCNGEFLIMPGGLALNIDGHDTVALSSSSSESRDVWVPSDEPQGPHYSRWRISEEHVQSYGGNLPSRLADNLFWLGRYVERADWTMRVMRNALNRGDEELRPIRRADSAECALNILLNFETDGSACSERHELPLEDGVRELLYSNTRSYSVRTTFRNVRRLAQQTRNRLSVDAWRLLNSLQVKQVQDATTPDTTDDLRDTLNAHLANISAFNGMSHENMTRNFGWRFLDIGRRIERALQLSKLLQKLLVQPLDDAEEADRLVYLLETTDSFMTYRARYRFAPAFALVLDLLMVDEKNPRSLAFQLVAIQTHIAALPNTADDAMRAPEQRLALDLLSKVRLSDPASMRIPDDDGVRRDLDTLLKAIVKGLPELSDTLSHRYFSLTHDNRPHRVHTRLIP